MIYPLLQHFITIEEWLFKLEPQTLNDFSHKQISMDISFSFISISNHEIAVCIMTVLNYATVCNDEINYSNLDENKSLFWWILVYE